MAGDKKHTTLHPAGYVEITSPDGVSASDTLQCVHCGGHWQIIPGSGRVRGWCGRCNGPTCGPRCLVGADCVPVEQLLENMEHGRSYDYRQIISRGS